MTSDLKSLARDAYVFGFPLVYDLREVISQTTAPKVSVTAPINLFGHAQILASPADKFVSLNNDTLYSLAHCDVSEEPLVLHLPDTHGRYYVMQFVDAWTNNFTYIGRRASGTAEGTYLLAAANWNGVVPAGMTRIQAPTSVFSIIGRYAVEGVADIPVVGELQSQTWITPLSLYPNLPKTSARHFGDREIAPWNKDVPEELLFWEQLRAWSQRFPPAAEDQRYLRSLASLGLLEPDSPYVSADSAFTAMLVEGIKAGQDAIQAIMRKGLGSATNGWLSAAHSFDYNLDFFGPGTIDAPEWKIDGRAKAYGIRAAAALGGLWGNHGYEAVYAYTYSDEAGDPLTGQRQYVLHFDKTPPVEAFWSLTMYDLPDYYLVENPINRYSIGDRTPGLQWNDDGSLDIYIQHDNPGADKEANWLPAPSDVFRPLMRMYQPGPAILDGSFALPPIRRRAG